MLSIVFITCNRKETLIAAIESCHRHISMPWELVVVDNHSEDKSHEVVADYAKLKNINFNYIYLEKNYGVAKARNIGFDTAKGEVVYFLDDDAVISTSGNCLDNAYNYMISQSKVYVMSTKIFDHKINDYLLEVEQKGRQLKTVLC